MGRKRKQLVEVQKADINTQVTPSLYDLPEFKSFFTTNEYHPGSKKLRSKNIFFLEYAIDQQIAEIKALVAEGKDKGFKVVVIGLSVRTKRKVQPPLVEELVSYGFSREFGDTIGRIFIKKFDGIVKSYHTKTRIVAVKAFFRFVNRQEDDVSDFTLDDLTKNHFYDFYLSLDLSSSSSDSGALAMTDTRSILVEYLSPAIANWLKVLRIQDKSATKKPASEHTSPLFQIEDDLYTDSVMYQMVGLLLVQFESIYKRFDYYDNLSESDMPEGWWDPRINLRYGKGKKVPIPHEYEKVLYVDKLFQEKNYQAILDHELIFRKFGFHGFKSFMFCQNNKKPQKQRKERQQRIDERMTKYRDFLKNNYNLAKFHQPVLSGFDGSGSYFRNLLGWCLANVLMIQTGINKEVALSIPSLSNSGGSILDNDDTLFLSKSGSSEIRLYGYKARRGFYTQIKEVPVVIQKEGLLHKLLKKYETYKTSSEGPFFEVDSMGRRWTGPGWVGSNFQALFPIVRDDGSILTRIDTRKFRKIYANAQLLDISKGAQSPQEMAEKIRDSIHHGNLDTTLNHYIFNTQRGAAAIDIAIIAITNGKLDESIGFRGRIEIERSQDTKGDQRIQVFLCDCEDPRNPTHNEVIHEQCRHYDLCLGCERSIVCKENLPSICVRIIQYENFRENNVRGWAEFYEDNCMIAYDALDQYASFESGGETHIEEAWTMARSGKVKLPPLMKGVL